MPRRSNKPPTSEKSRRFRASDQRTKSGDILDASLEFQDIVLPDADVYETDSLDNVQKIFKLGISGYKAAKDHTPSESTREPQYYDKHLDKALRVKKVVYCPGLNPQMGEIANRYYKKYVEKFGPPPTDLSMDADLIRSQLLGKGAIIVSAEEGITSNYSQIIPNITLPIVSALAFETPAPWSTHYLNLKKPKQDKAIADAALCIGLDYPSPSNHQCPYTSARPENKAALNCPTCDDPRRKEVEDTARYFPNITLFEFKSLRAGSYEHLIALLELTGNETFDWVECDGTCSDQSGERVTGARTGFDSENPIVQLEGADWTETNIGRSLRTSKPLVEPQNKHRVSAKRIVQQIWAEMVKNEATFLILSCGNFDMIAVRNRVEGVLYLGDPIRTTDNASEPTEAGYIQMLVGVFVASIRDAVHRAERLKACKDANNLPSSWTAYKGHYRIETPEPDKNWTPLNFEHVLFECQKLSLTSETKAGSSQYRPRNLYERYPKELGSFSLKIRIKSTENLNSNIFIGTVEWRGRAFQDQVVVKTACGKDAVQQLLHESYIFRSLGGDPQRCRIPVLYGFFVDLSNADEPYAALLQQYVGERLSDEPSKGQRESLDAYSRYMCEKGYQMDINKRSRVVGTNIDGDIYLVGLSRVRPLRRASELESDKQIEVDRKFKRPRKRGPSIHLGPVPNAKSRPEQIFKRVTTWIKKLERAGLPKTARCVGWLDDLSDWIEISIATEDIKKFEELWDKRPGALRGVVCVKAL